MAVDINADSYDYTVEELTARILEHGLPAPLAEIAAGNRPRALRNWCESVSGGDCWPLQDDFIPIWTCNQTQAMGFEPSTGHFHYQHVEDVVEGEPPEILTSYLHLCVWVLIRPLELDCPDAELEEAADFLGFQHLDLLRESLTEEEFFRRLSNP